MCNRSYQVSSFLKLSGLLNVLKSLAQSQAILANGSLYVDLTIKMAGSKASQASAPPNLAKRNGKVSNPSHNLFY